MRSKAFCLTFCRGGRDGFEQVRVGRRFAGPQDRPGLAELGARRRRQEAGYGGGESRWVPRRHEPAGFWRQPGEDLTGTSCVSPDGRRSRG